MCRNCIISGGVQKFKVIPTCGTCRSPVSGTGNEGCYLRQKQNCFIVMWQWIKRSQTQIHTDMQMHADTYKTEKFWLLKI